MSTNLSMTRGDTKVVQEKIGNLTAADLTGYTGFWFTAKNAVSDTDLQAVSAKTFADFTIVTPGDATNQGGITCEIIPAETNTLPDYVVNLLDDVQVKDGNGEITTVADSKLKVKPDKTRSA